MAGLLRPLRRSVLVCACGLWILGRGEAGKPLHSPRPAPVADSAFAMTSGTRADSATLKKSLRADSLISIVPQFRWRSPLEEDELCPEAAESAPGCWRRNAWLASQEIGFPGTRGWTLSLTRWEPIPFESPFFPAHAHSPYLSGGLAPPDRFILRKPGGDVRGLRESWTPVTPLDTPLTRLDWDRGALGMNLFNLRFQRMLSDNVYLDLEYYSATAESRIYDYQFNVHQPYLSGWGFLGNLYGPIDRDSASLVLQDTSHGIHSLNFRPRLGFWIDSNRVLEVFLNRVKNGTDLTRPRGISDPSRPGHEDSAQTLLPSAFSDYTEGFIYGQQGGAWTSQWEGAYSSVEETLSPLADSLGGAGGVESFTGGQFHAKVSAAAANWPGRPFLQGEAASESWKGRLFLKGLTGPEYAQAWNDREALEARLRPQWARVGLDAQAGLARHKRMDGRTLWLAEYGAAVKVNAPLGLDAEAGLSSREEDPQWEILYRRNPMLGRYPNPDLNPRTTQSYHGALTWSIPHLSLETGVDRLRLENAWLPFVLPQPGVCGALIDSVYADLSAQRCRADGAMPDSLALRLRNYRLETRDSWHLGLNLDLGRWNMNLRNHFLLSNRVEDAGLTQILANRLTPDRVFKGHIGWHRALVEDRLKLNLAWDWEWFSTRYAWAGLDGYSRMTKLDEYLVLDFLASMQIKSFLLYFKGMNLNHDRYATEPGVHPPGVNFRFGVDWTLRN